MEWQRISEPNSYKSIFDLSGPQIEEKHTEWSFEENKQFENALAEFDHSSPTFFENIASRVPSKSIVEVKNHYQSLVEDLDKIESGLIEPPEYQDDQCDSKAAENGKASSSKQQKGSASQQKRRGVPWTEDEHRDWIYTGKEIGGAYQGIVWLANPPTQIASHAQKYFRRLQNSTHTERRRPSIHDIHTATPTTTNVHSASAPAITTTSVPPENTENLPLPPQSSFSYNNMMINANNNNYPPPMTTTTTTTVFPQAEPTQANQSSTTYPSSSQPALSRNWFWS